MERSTRSLAGACEGTEYSQVGGVDVRDGGPRSREGALVGMGRLQFVVGLDVRGGREVVRAR